MEELYNEANTGGCWHYATLDAYKRYDGSYKDLKRVEQEAIDEFGSWDSYVIWWSCQEGKLQREYLRDRARNRWYAEKKRNKAKINGS